LLVFFTHHRPHLATRDLEFFEKAKASWIVEEVVQSVYQPMFEDDPGDERVRGMVYGWKLIKIIS